MSCVLDLNDIVIEMAAGPVTPFIGLSKAESAAVLAAVKITVDQPSDVITDNGIGWYGLRASDLQAIGVVKKGFVITNEMLECDSTFTGKNGIFSAIEILANEKLQQQVMIEIITSNLANLKAQGVITGNESTKELGGLAGLAAKYLPSEIKAFIDAAGGIKSNVVDAIGNISDKAAIALAALAAGGAVLASIKNADILGKLKGFGETIASLPELASDTIDSFTLDVEADKLVGVSRLPSVGDATKAAGTLADSAVAGVGIDTSLLDKASSAINSASTIDPRNYV